MCRSRWSCGTNHKLIKRPEQSLSQTFELTVRCLSWQLVKMTVSHVSLLPQLLLLLLPLGKVLAVVRLNHVNVWKQTQLAYRHLVISYTLVQLPGRPALQPTRAGGVMATALALLTSTSLLLLLQLTKAAYESWRRRRCFQFISNFAALKLRIRANADRETELW